MKTPKLLIFLFVILFSCKEGNDIQNVVEIDTKEILVKKLSEDKEFNSFILNLRQGQNALIEKMSNLPKDELDDFIADLRTKDSKVIDNAINKIGLSDLSNEFSINNKNYLSTISKRYAKEFIQLGEESKIRDIVMQATLNSNKKINLNLRPVNYCEDFCSVSEPITIGANAAAFFYCAAANQGNQYGFEQCLVSILPYTFGAFAVNTGICWYCCQSPSNCR